MEGLKSSLCFSCKRARRPVDDSLHDGGWAGCYGVNTDFESSGIVIEAEKVSTAMIDTAGALGSPDVGFFAAPGVIVKGVSACNRFDSTLDLKYRVRAFFEKHGVLEGQAQVVRVVCDNAEELKSVLRKG